MDALTRKDAANASCYFGRFVALLVYSRVTGWTTLSSNPLQCPCLPCIFSRVGFVRGHRV